VVPAGPKAHNTSTFVDAVGIPAASKNKGAAWLYVQWATSKAMMGEYLRTGSGTPPRASVYGVKAIQDAAVFPKEWFDTVNASLKLARSGLPEIVSVTEFRDTIGVALTNTLTGGDPAAEMKKATEAFKPILAKELA
jgi:multiple sugar transport system substrate-binding protein